MLTCFCALENPTSDREDWKVKPSVCLCTQNSCEVSMGGVRKARLDVERRNQMKQVNLKIMSSKFKYQYQE